MIHEKGLAKDVVHVVHNIGEVENMYTGAGGALNILFLYIDTKRDL